MKADAGGSQALVQAAMDYGSRGWRVHPILDGKRPRLPAWQKAASTDEEQIAQWWSDHPTDNVGVVLGEGSGIVDVEADSDEAEALWIELWRQAGIEPPVTPTFQSRRGKHRLFKWSASIPGAKAVVKIGELEIRTGNGGMGAQTVFPPSVHPSGERYKWLIHPDEAEVAELPAEILGRIANLAGENVTAAELRGANAKRMPEERRQSLLAGGFGEGQRNMAAAQFVGMLLAQTRDVFSNTQIEVAYGLTQNWNAGNRPPIDAAELDRTFQSILAAERRQRIGAQPAPAAADVAAKPAVPKAEEPAAKSSGWGMTIVKSVPRQYRITSPYWPGKEVTVDSDTLNNPRRLRSIVTEQADVVLWLGFDELWMGKKGRGGKDGEHGQPTGLVHQLMAAASVEEGDPEERRPAVIAEWLLSYLGKATPLKDAEKPKERPWVDDDGSILFRFAQAWQPMARFDDRIERGEFVLLLKAIGSKTKQVKSDGQPRRWKQLDKAAMAELQRIAEGGERAG